MTFSVASDTALSATEANRAQEDAYVIGAA